MSLIRRHSAQHKVYVPSSARENQYMLARLPISEAMLAKFAHTIDNHSDQPYKVFYETLAQIFFDIANDLDIDTAHFVANDHFVRVRFCQEEITSQTEQQILFLYNPRYHHSQKSFFDAAKVASRIRLLFLANGDEVRFDAAAFHNKVRQALERFSEATAQPKNMIRLCDHQHLTFDLFAKDKGVTGAQAHKFRSIAERYLADDVIVPATKEPLTYAVIDLPMNKRVQALVDLKKDEPHPYKPLYDFILDKLDAVLTSYKIKYVAVVANDTVPVVRHGEVAGVVEDGELLRLAYNPEQNTSGYISEINVDKLASKMQLVFVAGSKDRTNYGFGKFYNQIEEAVFDLAEQLEFAPEREEILVRFHQHLGYSFDS